MPVEMTTTSTTTELDQGDRSKVISTSKSEKSGKKTAAKKKRPFLTSSQLSDLFTRLDKNGDGELDLDEFSGIIRILGLDVNEDTVAHVFRQVDTETSGTLDQSEFICAYQKLYSAQSSNLDTKESKEPDGFVRATRYGISSDGTLLFELYLLTMTPSKVIEGVKYNILKESSSEKDIRSGSVKTVEDYLGNAKKEVFEGDLDTLNKMIYDDSQTNESSSRLLWWIDIAVNRVEKSRMSKLVATFGLPNNNKFMSNFGNFGNLLPKDPKSRIFVGKGFATQGPVNSISYFAQTAVLKDRPVLHLMPSAVDKAFGCGSGNDNVVYQALRDYYVSRFAFLLNFSGFSDTHKLEYKAQFQSAASIASRLHDGLGIHDVIHAEPTQVEGTVISPGDFSIVGSGGRAVPCSRQEGHHAPPTWVASNAQLNKNPPSIKFDTLGLHILDQGHAPNALLTIRSIDDENYKKKRTIEERSRCGVIGRLIDGLWLKLLENTILDGVTDTAGELDDNPVVLASFIMTLMHSFSMNSMGAIDYWVNVVQDEVKDMVVSKHSSHIKLIRRIVKEMTSYVDPIHDLYNQFFKEWEDEQDEENEGKLVSAKEPEQPPAHFIAHTKSGRAKHHRGSLIMSGSDVKVLSNPLVEVDKLPLSYNLVKAFYGDSFYRDMRLVMDGNEALDLKGLMYWKERLEKYDAKLTEVDELIASQLDEKRNFTTFSLTIITTVLAPMAILTGYFGMNFDNMVELDSGTYKYAPGVTLMWILCGVIYGLMLLFSLHFRIIYSAT